MDGGRFAPPSWHTLGDLAWHSRFHSPTTAGTVENIPDGTAILINPKP